MRDMTWVFSCEGTAANHWIRNVYLWSSLIFYDLHNFTYNSKELKTDFNNFFQKNNIVIAYL